MVNESKTVTGKKSVETNEAPVKGKNVSTNELNLQTPNYDCNTAKKKNPSFQHVNSDRVRSLVTLKHWANVGPLQSEMLGQCRHAGLDVLDQYRPDVGPTHGCPPGQYWQTTFKTLDNTGKT